MAINTFPAAAANYQPALTTGSPVLFVKINSGKAIAKNISVTIPAGDYYVGALGFENQPNTQSLYAGFYNGTTTISYANFLSNNGSINYGNPWYNPSAQTFATAITNIDLFGASNDSNTVVTTAPDGAGSAYQMSSTYYLNGKWIVTGAGSTNYNAVYTTLTKNSVNAPATWSKATPLSGATGVNTGWHGGGAYGTSTYVIGSYNSARVAYSTDAITWNTAAIAGWTTTYSVYGLAFGNGKFAAVSNGTTSIAYSTNAVTWSTVSPTGYTAVGNENTIGYYNGYFIVADGAGKVHYSTDAVTWSNTTVQAAGGAGRWISYNKGLYRVGFYWSTTTYNAFYTSTNLITWTQQTVYDYTISCPQGQSSYITTWSNLKPGAPGYLGSTWDPTGVSIGFQNLTNTIGTYNTFYNGGGFSISVDGEGALVAGFTNSGNVSYCYPQIASYKAVMYAASLASASASATMP